MKATINVYLNFSGNCREAMEFYNRTFGGELHFLTARDAGMDAHWPESRHNDIVHCELRNGSLCLLGSDMGSRENEKDGNTVSLSVICESAEQQRSFYEGISAGGSNLTPPHDFPQGRMAAVTDKYGKNWMFYYDTINAGK